MKRGLLLAAAAVLLAACGPVPQPAPSTSPPASATPSVSAPQSGLLQVHDPGQVTGTLTGPCHAGDSGQLPDPHCTPGAYDPAITAAVLCAPGYTTRTYRAPSSETTPFKWNTAVPAYGYGASFTGELDHLVPLELGGANDAANLWPEAGTIPNAKDHVETVLHDWVCAGGSAAQTRLGEAQGAIARDWQTAEKMLGVTS